MPRASRQSLDTRPESATNAAWAGSGARLAVAAVRARTNRPARSGTATPPASGRHRAEALTARVGEAEDESGWQCCWRRRRRTGWPAWCRNPSSSGGRRGHGTSRRCARRCWCTPGWPARRRRSVPRHWLRRACVESHRDGSAAGCGRARRTGRRRLRGRAGPGTRCRSRCGTGRRCTRRHERACRAGAWLRRSRRSTAFPSDERDRPAQRFPGSKHVERTRGSSEV